MRVSTGLIAAALLASVPLLAHAETVVAGSTRTEMLDCNGGDAQVSGDGNRLVFHGDCRALRLDGSHNVVEIDLVPTATVTVTGDDNRVFYTPVQPGPEVTAQGEGNLVTEGTQGEASAALGPMPPEAPPPPAVVPPPQVAASGTLTLSGDRQDSDVDCTGRRVVIEGSDGRFVLHGGCRSITVQGRADTITADLVPGAHVAISGDAVTLHYTLTQAGPPPVISVSGARSTAVATAPRNGVGPAGPALGQPGDTAIIGGPAP